LRSRGAPSKLAAVRRPAPPTPTPTISGPHPALREALDGVRARCDLEARRRSDPVAFVHRYTALADQELVALIASALAFGNVTALVAKIEDALTRLGPDLCVTADDPALVAARLRGWKHRVYQDRDLTGLVVGARRVQRASGSLGQALAAELQRSGDLRPALSAFTARIRREGGLDGERRGGTHLLPDPSKGSAVKRLMLFLRWMIRPADGIDLGLWPLSPALLLIPVDTHIHKLGRNLALTRRNDVSWTTAEEITAALRKLDPADPVKYDFSLCHLGMLQHCPSRRDPARCEGCGVKPVCRHWAPAPKPAKMPPSPRPPARSG
jgi:uncharacterized protein (TIGR02757 family)